MQGPVVNPVTGALVSLEQLRLREPSGSLGATSDTYDREWQSFLEQRNLLVTQILDRLGLARTAAASSGLQGPQASQLGDLLANQQVNEAAQQGAYQAPVPFDLEELIGAAQFYGIQNPEKIPPDVLQQMVRDQRLKAQEADDGGILRATLSGFVAAGAGFADELLEVSQRIPFIGDVISRRQAVHSAESWIAKMEEGFRGTLPGEDPDGLMEAFSIIGEYGGGSRLSEQAQYEALRRIGGLIGYAIPAAASWKLAGAAGAMGSSYLGVGASATTGGFIARSALQGGVATWMTEGGGDEPLQHRAMAIGIGAGFGAAAAAIPVVFRRIQRSFPTASRRMPETETIPVGQESPVVDAEWEFLDDAVGLPGSQQPRGLLAPPRPGTPAPGGPPELEGYVARPFGDRVNYEPLPPDQPDILESVYSDLWGTPAERAARRAAAQWEGQIAAGVYGPRRLPAGQYEMPSNWPTVRDPVASSVAAYQRGNARTALGQIPWIGGEFGIDPSLLNEVPLPAGWFGRNGGRLLLAPGEAQAEAIALSKHTALVESPVLADISAQPRFDDFDVAKAAVVSRPAGVSVIQGVGDTGKFVQQALRTQVEGGIGPQDFRVVQLPGGRTDILVAAGRSISNRMAGEYKQFGMFSGQTATVNGTQVEIVRPSTPDGMTTVRSVYGGEEFTVSGSQVVSGRGSTGTLEAPGLYSDFRNHVLGYMEAESRAAGIPQFDWTSSEVSSQLPRLLEGFLDERGIGDNLTRAALTNYFDRMRVLDFKSLAPAEAVEAAAIRAEAGRAVTVAQAEGRTLEQLPALAEERGFVIVSEGDRLVVQDGMSDLSVPVQDEASAVAFLSEFQREAPDFTTVSDVPAELIEAVPGGIHPGTSIDYAPASPSQQIEVAELAINRTNRMFGGGGGGDVPPALPPASGPGEPGRLGGAESLGGQFRRLARDDPQRFQEMLDRMTSQAAQLFLPMRNFTLRGEEILHSYGIDRGVMWQQYSRATTGLDVAHNELTPYFTDLNDIIRTFRRRLVRTGVVRDVMEASGPQAKGALMDLHEFTPDERRAIERLNFFTHQVWHDARQSGFDIGYIPDYMPRLRAARAGGGDPFASNTTIGQQGQVFFEYAREGGLDVREPDAGVLLTHWLRSWKMAQHVTPALNDIIETWQVNVPNEAASIPSEIRRVMQDWVRVVRFGHGPEHEFAVQGVRRTLNSLGVPLTDGEVVSLYNSAFTNAYRAQLGFRPDVWFRDSIQPLLTGSKIGFGPVREAYVDFFRSPSAREEMWQRALRGGWVVQGMVQVPTADVFEVTAQGAAGANLFSPAQEARREMLAGVGDMLHDATPRGARGGIQGTLADPLLIYTKEGEFNRLISGEAGWRRASRAIEGWRRAGASTDSAALQQVTREAGAQAWRGPIQREFVRLLTAGDHEGAASLLANEAANMQFRYGTREASPVVQRAGMKGRFAMMFGTFTNQYMANMAELAARDIPTAERTAFALRYSSIVAALAGASAAVGWNFGKWQWHQSTTFAGGPPLHALVNAWYQLTGLYTGARNEWLNPETRPEYITPHQQTELSEMQRQAQTPGAGLLPPMIAGAAQTFFPYSGGISTLQNVGDALRGPGAAETLPQFLLTGERPGRAREQNAQDYFMGTGEAHAAAMDTLLRSGSLPGGGSRY
jgi:hypothetical protein